MQSHLLFVLGHKNFGLYAKNDKEKCWTFSHKVILCLKPLINEYLAVKINQTKNLFFTSITIEKLSWHQLRFPQCLLWLIPPPSWLNTLWMHQMHELCCTACALVCKSMQKSIAMITIFPHCHPGNLPLRKRGLQSCHLWKSGLASIRPLQKSCPKHLSQHQKSIPANNAKCGRKSSWMTLRCHQMATVYMTLSRMSTRMRMKHGHHHCNCLIQMTVMMMTAKIESKSSQT